MGLQWMEALLPLGIIAGMLCAAGNIQYFVHKAANGRPKHIGNDDFDLLMDKRDKRVISPSPPS